MKGKRISSRRRWERILDAPICFGDWNCLTASYKYGKGLSSYKACRWTEECRIKHKERKDLDG